MKRALAQLRLDRVATAVFSADRIFRYELRRTWEAWPICNFLMLNPSTADEHRNDPTVERCERFAMAWAYGSVVITNLFAFRSTEPNDLRGVADAVGPENDEHVVRVATEADLVVLAWGEHGVLNERAAAVLQLLRTKVPDRELHCLGRNKSGQPVHPLYQPAATKPVLYEGAA